MITMGSILTEWYKEALKQGRSTHFHCRGYGDPEKQSGALLPSELGHTRSAHTILSDVPCKAPPHFVIFPLERRSLHPIVDSPKTIPLRVPFCLDAIPHFPLQNALPPYYKKQCLLMGKTIPPSARPNS